MIDPWQGTSSEVTRWSYMSDDKNGSSLNRALNPFIAFQPPLTATRIQDSSNTQLINHSSQQQ
jgi:hypothetical protein